MRLTIDPTTPQDLHHLHTRRHHTPRSIDQAVRIYRATRPPNASRPSITAGLSRRLSSITHAADVAVLVEVFVRAAREAAARGIDPTLLVPRFTVPPRLAGDVYVELERWLEKLPDNEADQLALLVIAHNLDTARRRAV